MNGGPGASSLMGFFTELGPFLLNDRSRPPPTLPSSGDDTGWRLFPNQYSWSTVASLLVWEQPAGVGFSRCVDGGGGGGKAVPCSAVWDDTTSAAANVALLHSFFAAMPSERRRPL